MPVATARNIFPQFPPCCRECGSTQLSKSFNPCSTAELWNFCVLSCCPSHGWAGAPTPPASLRNMEIASLDPSSQGQGDLRVCRKLDPSEVWLFVFTCFSCTGSDSSGNTLCCRFCPQQQSSILCSGPEPWDSEARG